MFGIGPMEMVIVGIVAVLLFGSRLPSVARSLGKSMTEFKKGMREFENEMHSAVYSEPHEPRRPTTSRSRIALRQPSKPRPRDHRTLPTRLRPRPAKPTATSGLAALQSRQIGPLVFVRGRVKSVLDQRLQVVGGNRSAADASSGD